MATSAQTSRRRLRGGWGRVGLLLACLVWGGEAEGQEPPTQTVALGDLTDLAAPEFRHEQVGQAGEQVRYTFELSAPRAVGIGVRQQEWNADLVVVDAVGREVGRSAEAGVAREWLELALGPGQYRAAVVAQESGENAYVFRYGVKGVADDYVAATDTSGTVLVDEGTTGAVDYVGDEDWFFVDLEAGRSYRVAVAGGESSPVVVGVYDAGGTAVTAGVSGLESGVATFQPAATGLYYIGVAAATIETGAYTLAVTDTTPAPPSPAQQEPAPGSASPPPEATKSRTINTPAQAPERDDAADLGDITNLSRPGFPNASLDGTADAVAYWRFTLTEAKEVGLGLRRLDADADLVLEDEDGTVLSSSRESGTTNEWLGATLVAGTYYVRVEAREAGANDFKLRYGVNAPAVAAARPVWLPGGCEIEQLDATDGTLRKSDQWRRGCRSVIRFKQSNAWDSPRCSVTGYARYYSFAVSEESDITITNTASDGGSQHYVIRNIEGEIVRHVLYHGDWRYPEAGGGLAECSAHYEIPCVPRRELQTTLPAGTYLFELVQHYTTHPFPRPPMAFEITLSGSGLSLPVFPFEFGVPPTQAALEGCTPGEAATPLWTATLSAGRNASVVPAMAGYSVWTRRGALSSTRFSHAGTSYRVLALIAHAGGLYLHMTPALPGDFTLEIGGRTFAANASAIPAPAAAGRYWWAAESLDWAEDEELEVRITGGDEAAIERPPAPPTAHFADVPARHDGADAFGLRLYFSEDLPIDAAALAAAVAVTYGTLTNVEPVTGGSTRVWALTVQPTSAAAVTVALPPGEACGGAGALCTADGRQLFNHLTVDIPGP